MCTSTAAPFVLRRPGAEPATQFEVAAVSGTINLLCFDHYTDKALASTSLLDRASRELTTPHQAETEEREPRRTRLAGSGTGTRKARRKSRSSPPGNIVVWMLK
jgi:hypothetical protein